MAGTTPGWSSSALGGFGRTVAEAAVSAARRQRWTRTVQKWNRRGVGPESGRSSGGLRRPERRVPVIAPALLLVGALLGATGGGLPTKVAAGASSPLATQLDNALQNARSQTGAPGAQGAVMACGQLVWSGASGTKSMTPSEPVTPTTPFILASTTKTVTAAMVMKLIEEKPDRISLNTPLSNFYPSLPNAQTITIRMLLNNTSGLPHYEDNPVIAPLIKQPSHTWTAEQVISALSKEHSEFVPGAKYDYNNANWVVLAGIIPQVAGIPMNAYFDRVIAKPADLKQSTFAYEPARSSEFAHPYKKGPNGALTDQFAPGVGIPSSYWGPTWGDGGLASTALDLAKFASALFAGNLVSQSPLAEMKQLGPSHYGLGLTTYEDGERTWYGHAGSYGGYESEDWTDTTRHLTITVTADLDGAKGIWAALERTYAQSAPATSRCG